MADNTRIEWADATVNAINGCSITSPGCTNCYAMRLAGTRMKNHPTRAALTQESKAGPVWTGEVRLHEPALLQPLKWRRPRRIFWNAHGDLFHENVPWEWTAKVMAVAFLTPHHTHMILTKRADRMHDWFETLAMEGGADDFSDIIEYVAEEAGLECDYPEWTLPLDNVWLGVSVEDQARADERIPDLLATPAAVRFISAEPLLGPVDLTMLHHDGVTNIDALRGMHGVLQPMQGECDKLDWVIAGGESGPGARPMHPDWARSLRDQCAAAGVAFHFKQWGSWLPWEPVCPPEWQAQNGQREDHHALLPADIDDDSNWDDGLWAIPEHDHFAFQRVGKKAAGRLLDGREWNEVPPCAS